MAGLVLSRTDTTSCCREQGCHEPRLGLLDTSCVVSALCEGQLVAGSRRLGAASRLELDNLASFLKGAVAYKKKIGFKGELLLEPKPQVRGTRPSNRQSTLSHLLC